MKKFFSQNILILLSALYLTGCSIFQSNKPPTPAPLPELHQTLNIQKQWDQSIGDGSSKQYLKLTPVIVDNKIFADSYDGKIAAFNKISGKKIWQIDTKTNLTSGLAAGKGMLFVGTENGQVLALQQDTGKTIWSQNLSSAIIAKPCISDNVLIVKAENGELDAFNIYQGNQLWTYSHEEPTFILRGNSSPQTFENLVVAPFANGELTVINLYNGQLIWREFVAEPEGNTAIQRMVDIAASPQIFNKTIYVVTYNGRVAALNLTTGQVIWQHELSSTAGLIVDTNNTYVADDKGWIWAFDRKTGDVIWRQNELLNHMLSAPVLTENTIVVADTQGYLHFMAKNDGHFVARVMVDKKGIIANPIAVDNDIYIYTINGKLIKFKVIEPLRQ